MNSGSKGSLEQLLSSEGSKTNTERNQKTTDMFLSLSTADKCPMNGPVCLGRPYQGHTAPDNIAPIIWVHKPLHHDKVAVQDPRSPRLHRSSGASTCRSADAWKRPGFKTVLSVLGLVLSLAFCHTAANLQRDNETRDAYSRLLATEADKMPNLASLASAEKATVMTRRSSKTFGENGSFFETLLSMFFPKHLTVMQSQSPLVPGHCWAFAGDQGHLHVQLAAPTHISHVTVGHIAKVQSFSGDISSAPREFSVYAMETLDAEEELLGTFIYDENGPCFQTFALPNQDQNQDFYQHVRLQVQSNWGNVEYTCLYNFRVHGKLLTRLDNTVY